MEHILPVRDGQFREGRACIGVMADQLAVLHGAQQILAGPMPPAIVLEVSPSTLYRKLKQS